MLLNCKVQKHYDDIKSYYEDMIKQLLLQREKSIENFYENIEDTMTQATKEILQIFDRAKKWKN